MNDFITDFRDLLNSEGLNPDIELIDTIDQDANRVIILWLNRQVNLVFTNWEAFEDYPSLNKEEKNRFLRYILSFFRSK